MFAVDHGVLTRTLKGFAVLSLFFFLFILPLERVAARESTLKPKRVENALRVGTLFRNASHPLGPLLQLCGQATLQILGSVNVPPSDEYSDPKWVFASTDPASGFPSFSSSQHATLAVQVIMFDRPSPTRMQYMSLAPISLALGDKAPNSDSPFSDVEFDEEAQRERIRKAKLVNKIGLHTVIRQSPTQKELLLPVILNQINCSAEISQLLAKNTHLLRTREKRSLSVGERVVESAATLWDYLLAIVWQFLYPSLTRAFVIGLVCHRVIAEVILRILEWRPRPESFALKDISATAQQVDIRLQQFCYWPIQYLTLRKRKDEWESITDRHPEYIRFYNSLWLVANDVIIGIAVGSYIIDNAEWVAFQINTILSDWTVEGLRNMILWLTDAPAGLKLNNELAVFLGALFIWVIDYWKGESSLHPALTASLTVRRMCRRPSSIPSECHLLRWVLEFCRGDDADLSVFGLDLGIDCPHLLLLHGIRQDIPLATYYHRFSLSPLPR
ncbi:MAG: hypothetical protein Q9219_004288 [cf. Caloplaca sp. 3 TL-2023]